MEVRDLDLPQRKSIRLISYDYSSIGYYFITICTHNRQHLFGSIICDEMVLNKYGKIVQQDLSKIPERFYNVELDKYIIMPNHIHFIIVIGPNPYTPLNSDRPATERSRPFPTIPKILGLFKSGTTRKAHELNSKIIIWQKSYYDHIIRNEQEYQEIWKYIDTNPLLWHDDCYY
ncbi:MAG TPA: transposase [Clostridiaceae bacterium]|jgi:REP element-mobilizing transposase RayT|nr:transposase [Clostridiaceae bacterium]HBF77087.1 transposase [Clostridiaceae bacterium]HBG37879.1 transposase [Clostridiaceae bacterium]HBN27710.1 transposase [Clostridiaceae bacterium]HBX48997.1 transposase [Clostridiaceae bacterium]